MTNRRSKRRDDIEDVNGARVEPPSLPLFAETKEYLREAQARIDAIPAIADSMTPENWEAVNAMRPPWHAPHDLTRAYARDSDPDTSAAAADRATLNMTAARAAVLECFQKAFREIQNIPIFGREGEWYSCSHGEEGAQFSDEELLHSYRKYRQLFPHWPLQTDSGLRSRRAELVKLGKIKAVGTTINRLGNKTTLWGLYD